ncbi:hypothetical protein T484DRAFT_1803258 [Baffinella frigidus]|nr:hypothetical protein T484DRAFT_1803258 [Cryptophyta sp. CCMP2293]
MWHGNTALQKGAERGGAAVVRTLLEFNASHTIIDRGWWREPLHYAKNAETVAALLAGGANHTALDKAQQGDTSLHPSP